MDKGHGHYVQRKPRTQSPNTHTVTCMGEGHTRHHQWRSPMIRMRDGPVPDVHAKSQAGTLTVLVETQSAVVWTRLGQATQA